MSQESSLSIEAQERIAEELIRFPRALKNNDAPLIEDYLDGFPGRERAAMLKQLILTEA